MVDTITPEVRKAHARALSDQLGGWPWHTMADPSDICSWCGKHDVPVAKIGEQINPGLFSGPIYWSAPLCSVECHQEAHGA